MSWPSIFQSPPSSPAKPAVYPAVGADTRDLRAVLREVENGLPNERTRLDDALKNNDFWKGDLKKYINYREAESTWDHEFRPRRYSRILRRFIEILTSHLYAKGPQRRLDWDDPVRESVQAWLDASYTATHINALMQRADQLAHLNDVACLQVYATGGPGGRIPSASPSGDEDGSGNGEVASGDIGTRAGGHAGGGAGGLRVNGRVGGDTEGSEFESEDEAYATAGDKALAGFRVKVHLLGSEEFAVWCEPGDPAVPWCVCTKAVFDQRTRYQVWTAEEVITYYTQGLTLGQTAGGRVAHRVGSESGANPYGCLPFAFVHYDLPTREFWTPGVGTDLRKANDFLNNWLSDMADKIRYYSWPIPLAFDCGTDWRPTVRPGSITQVPNAPGSLSSGKQAKVELLQAKLYVEELWKDTNEYINHLRECFGIPKSSALMDAATAPSAVAILAEAWPLIVRAQGRQLPFAVYEENLAKLMLKVAGAYYQNETLWAAGHGAKLSTTWPTPELGMPGPDREQDIQSKLATGRTSVVEVVMADRGITRDQAEEVLEQIAKDKRFVQDLELVEQAEPSALESAPEDGSASEVGAGEDKDVEPAPAEEKPEEGAKA